MWGGVKKDLFRDFYSDRIIIAMSSNLFINGKWGCLPENQWKTDDCCRVFHDCWDYSFTNSSDDCFNNSDFKKAVKEFNDFVQNEYSKYYGVGNYRPLFRGQACDKWPPLPGVLREDFIQSVYAQNRLDGMTISNITMQIISLERNILKLFRKEGYSLVNPDTTDSKWYALAQHHGLPTRLLDWSNSPLVALWMAVEHSADQEDGCIYSINYAPKEAYKEKVSFWTEDRQEELMQYLMGENKSDINEDIFKNEMIIHINPNKFSPRLVSQHAHFTLHTPATKDSKLPCNLSIEDVYDSSQFTIKKEYKRYYRTYLMQLGIQRWSLWPDLDNIARGIRDANIVTRKGN